jgi:hypothetical protein
MTAMEPNGQGNHSPASLLARRDNTFGEQMNKLAISLAVGAGALFATAASAAPLSVGAVASDSNIQNVRMVCDERGRCWRQRDERRVIIRDSYDYAPRERYYDRRDYYDRGPGVGIAVPGVSIGIGGNRY